MKDELCEAFCDGVLVREMKNGFAIRTPYDDLKGEPLAFYAIGPNEDGLFRIIDDGTTVPFLEASGVSLESETRFSAFTGILQEYKASYSEGERQIYMPSLRRDMLAGASLRFMALLLRVQDLALMTPDRVESTFRDDVMEKLRERFQKEADFRENEPVNADLHSAIPDVVIQAQKKQPVAVFVATSGQKIQEAVYLYLIANYEFQMMIRVVAILEGDQSNIPFKLRQRADNYLDAVPRYAGDERATLDRIAREVYGRDALIASTPK
jgi:hypothetical protein